MRISRLWLALLAGGAAMRASAETWETMSGERIEATLSGVYGPFVVLAERNGSRLISVANLKDAELGRVADFLAAKPAAVLPWASSTSKVAKALKGRLQVLRNDKLVEFDVGARAEPEFYLVYFGCRVVCAVPGVQSETRD